MSTNIQKSSLSPTTVRFSESEKSIVAKAAKKERRSMAAFIRLAAVDQANAVLSQQLNAS